MEARQHDHDRRPHGWSGTPAEHAVRGVHAMTLWTADPDATTRLLEGAFGMRRYTVEERTMRFVPAAPHASGIGTTEVIDRKYFHSVYFREPVGALCEIATDVPGFTVDEPLATLGESLVLPPWLEPERSAIAAALPAIELPSVTAAA